MTKLGRVAGALALTLMVGLSQARATVVTFNVAGAWGALDNLPPESFQGTVTYDTSTLNYRDGNNSGYGPTEGGNDAGSYGLSWNCLIPRFDGAILSLEWKEAVWDRFVMGAPRPRTPSEQQYSDRKLRSRR